MNLLLLDRTELGEGTLVRVCGPRARHLIEVLKVVPGQTVRMGVLDGNRGEGVVKSIGTDSVDLVCTLETAKPPRPRVDLLLALPRPKVMRRLWAQLAALGVGRIILTNAEQVERPYFDTHVLSPECYHPLLIEGLQQAKDTTLPLVSIHRRFRILIEDELPTLSSATLKLVADPGADASMREVVPAALGMDERARVLLAIGPEGGWNAFELALLAAHGFCGVGIGPRTLRTDTACVALLALVHDALNRRS